MTKTTLSIAFSIGLFFVLIWMAWEAASFQQLASYFPLYISLFAIVLIVIDTITQIRKAKKKKDGEEDKINKNMTASVIKYILWFTGYLVIMLLIGFLMGTSIFLILFLMLETKYKIIKTIIITALTIMIIIILGYVMGLEWPAGIIAI